jgi:hypothetical protein
MYLKDFSLQHALLLATVVDFKFFISRELALVFHFLVLCKVKVDSIIL